MVVHTATDEVTAAQRAILELLLINHPLDCPICDKGGECPLQDQTFKFGPGRSRFVEQKRDFAKPVSLGPILVLDRERCVLCWRCVRFGELIAGDDALKGLERGFHSEINTPFTGPVQSKFIGNTISICPVGALTAKPYRFVARPWDNVAVPSVCTHCGLGCAVFFDVRDGAIMRTRPREQPAINDVWLCDLGYYGHAYVGHAERLRRPLVRGESGLVETSWEDALDRIVRRLRERPRVGVLGGARLTNEDAYVAMRFFRGIVGTPHLDHRVDAPADSPSAMLQWGMVNTIADVSAADAILLVGCDITEEYPVLWLRMKQAIDRGASLIAVTPKGLEVARFAAHHLVHRYGEGGAVIDAFRKTTEQGPGTEEQGGVPVPDIEAAAAAFANAAHPMVMVGRLALDAPDGWEIVRALNELCGHRDIPFNVLRGRGNAYGAALAGLVPHAGPGGQPLEVLQSRLEAMWGAPVTAAVGMGAAAIIDSAAHGSLDVLYVIGADPATDAADRQRWMEAKARGSFIVVHDAFLTETARIADVVLPVLVIPEKDGTVSNLEGRIQRIHAAVRGPGEARADWEIFEALAQRLGTSLAYDGWENIFAELAAVVPGVHLDARVPPDSRSTTPLPPEAPGRADQAGALYGSEYPFVVFVGDVLFDQGSMTSRCPAIADLAGVPWTLIHPADAQRAGIGDGSAVAVTSPRSTVVVRAHISTDIPPGTIYLPRGFEGIPVNALFDGSTRPTQVRIEAVNGTAPAETRRETESR
jgi:NADH-quinone oxidoreductase subunit G